MKNFSSLVLAVGLLGTLVFADGTPVRKFARIPPNPDCKGSPCMFGDPVITTSQNTISFDRSEDVRIQMPNGIFSFNRRFVSDRDALGQVEGGIFPPISYCGLSVLTDLVPPFGVDNSNSSYTHTLQSLVDTRCPTHTRVLTPDGDVRYFGAVPSVPLSGFAWVPRLVGEGAGEPSRLKASSDAFGNISFQWFAESGESYTYGLQGPVYRMTAARNSADTALYSVSYGTVCPNKIEPISVSLAESVHVVQFTYTSCALTGISVGTRVMVTYAGPVASHAESGTPGGWRDIIGLESSKDSLVHPPEDLADNMALQPATVVREQRHIHTKAYGLEQISNSSEGWWGVSLQGPETPQAGALSSSFSGFAECGEPGQTCCNGNLCSGNGCCSQGICTAAGTVCSIGGQCMASSCGTCGALGQSCCTSGTCTAAGATCINSQCQACGGLGQPCCVSGAIATCTQGNTACLGGLCSSSAACVTDTSQRTVSTVVAGGTVLTRLKYARGGLTQNTPYGLGASYAPQPVGKTKECQGFADPYICQASSVQYLYGHSTDGINVNLSCGTVSQPTSRIAVRDEAQSYTVTPTIFSSAAGGNFEDRTTYRGASSATGANPLATNWRTFSYTGDRQELVTEEEPSALQPGQRAITTRKYDATGLLTSVVRTGYRRDAATGVIGQEHQVLFYRHGTRCAGWSDLVARRRVSSIEGPCKVADANATSCQGSGWLVSDLYYYDTQASPPIALPQSATQYFNDGRLAVVRTFANGCGGAFLETKYATYTAEGMPSQLTTPDSVVQDSITTGALTTNMSGRDLSKGTSIDLRWDRGHLQKVAQASGEYWRACYGSITYASQRFFPSCPKPVSQAPGHTTGEPMWVGRFSADGTPREHYRFVYSRDQRLSLVEFYADIPEPLYPPYNSDLPLWWRTIGTDSDRRWVSSVLADKLPTVVRRDARGQVVAFGSGFDFANPGMPSSAPLSCLGSAGGFCKQLTYDRLGRTTSFIKPADNGASSGDNVDCLAYDPQGNLSSYARGCAPFTCTNGVLTSVSVDGSGALSVTNGPTCSASPISYVYDDFGELISITQKHGATLAETRLDYDARGTLVKRQTAQQRLTNTNTQFIGDAFGRVGSVFELQSGGGASLLVRRAFDQAAPPVPTVCLTKFPAPTYTSGRLAWEQTPVWNVWYSYNKLGQTVGELRLLTGQLDCTTSESQNWNQTRYSYGYRGRLEEIQYPFGRRVRYNYPPSPDSEGRDAELPIGIDVEIFGAMTSWFVPMLTTITWHADGLLKSYRAPTYQARPTPTSTPTWTNTVTYEYAGGTDVETPPSNCSVVPTAGSDGTRRLRRIRAVSDQYGAVNDQWYTWNADQVVSVDRCYWNRSTPLNEFRVPLGQRGFSFRGELTAATMPTPGGALAEASRLYAYDERGNRLRVAHHSTLPAKGVLSTYINADRLESTQAASVTATSATPLAGSKDTVAYSYDLDGRTTQETSAVDSTAQPNSTIRLTFPSNGFPGNGGYDSVVRAVSVDGATYYNYYYDGSNRRVRKQHPTGAVEDFFYGPASNLISERSFTYANNSTGNTVDEYIWLNGLPVGSLRSVFNGNMARFDDWDGFTSSLGTVCPRRNENARCGWYWLNPDRLGRPTMVVDKNYRISGAGEYDAFGAFGRIEKQVETPHPYASNSTHVLATGLIRDPYYYALRARVRLSFAETKMRQYQCGWFTCASYDYLRVNRTGGADLYTTSNFAIRGSFVTPWFPIALSSTFDVSLVTDQAVVGSGLVMSGWDYLRVEVPNTTSTTSMPYFPALRFPGQYYDEETGLHENQNRYYDPALGRYLSPEPLLQSPAYVRRMAQNGMSVPTYAYAANNPIRHIDANGLYFTVNSPNANAIWESLGRLAANRQIGWEIERMAADPSTEFQINEIPYENCGESGARTSPYERNANGDLTVAIDFNMMRTNADLATYYPGRGHEAWTLDALLGHELGHGSGMAYGALDHSTMALDWENAVRQQSPLRLDHYQGGQCVNRCTAR